MHLNVPPDLETLVDERLSTGGYANAKDVLRRALEARGEGESWTDEERRALTAHIEEVYSLSAATSSTALSPDVKFRH